MQPIPYWKTYTTFSVGFVLLTREDGIMDGMTKDTRE